MEVGIIGLPKSGKTTLFNALTRGKAVTSAYSAAASKSNVGIAKVPDPRLDPLRDMFKPKKVVHAEVRYVDIPGAPKALGKGEGIGGQFLSELGRVDTLLHVVRTFRRQDIPHVETSIDPYRDIATMDAELALVDLAFLERRLQRLAESIKKAKPQERDALHKEQELLARIQTHLENNQPLREQNLTEEEQRLLTSYQFLTAKPLLIVLNMDEEDLPKAAALEAELASRCHRPETCTAAMCGKLEMELAELEVPEAEEFRRSLGIAQSSMERVIKMSYELLGLITFLTVGPDEVRAWPIYRGTVAQKAAGKVHSDIERGFIRAEVISFEDLVQCGTLAEARKRGLLRLEGKDYIVQDGDVIEFLFNI